MDSADYAVNLMLIQLLVGRLMHCPLEVMIRVAERAESVGPILDPTLFMKQGKKLRQDIETLTALAKIQKEWNAHSPRPILETPGAAERLGDDTKGVGMIIITNRRAALESVMR